jgi:hypothetical protein
MTEALTILDLGATWRSGAPAPFILAGEHRLRLMFHANVESGREAIAVLRIDDQVALSFGLPHEDSAGAHRLAPCGFTMESAFEVVNSAWIDELKRMEGEGWQPNLASLACHRHFIFSFRDRVLEFVAPSFQFELTDEPYGVVLNRMVDEALS